MDENISVAIDDCVNAWLVEHLYGSPVAQCTEAWNHLFKALPALKASLAAALCPFPATESAGPDLANKE